MAKGKLTGAVDTALAAAVAHESSSELEKHHIDFVHALLVDARDRLAILPALLATADKAQAVQDAERALEAAQAAQRG